MNNSREKYLKFKEKSRVRTSSYIALSDDIVMTIEAVMKKKDITKSEFAKLLGKKPSVISKWFNGQHNFTIKTIVDIENALGRKVIKPLINIKRKEEIIIITGEFISANTYQSYEQKNSRDNQETFTFKKMEEFALLKNNGKRYLN